MKNEEIITVDELLNNLSIYKELLNHINSLNPSVLIRIGATYIRVSSDSQTEYSPEAQLEDIIKYCIKNNIMLPKENIFLEPGISGRSADKRPQFQLMISKAIERTHPIDIIIVHKFDRLARNREESVVYKSMLRKKHNVEVVSVKELLPEDKKLALIIESQLETYGEYFLLNLSEEVYKGLRKKADRGEHGSRPPLGYKKIVVDVIRENGVERIIRKMVVVEEEAKIVIMIFERFADGEKQLQITRYLNSMGFRTKNNGIFSDRAINWILNNPVYIGYMRWTEGGMNRDWNNPNTISKESSHEAIISKELWDRVQKRIFEQNLIYGKKRKKMVKNEHWLRGLIKCDSCGETIVKNGKFFQCTGYTHGRCTISHSITVKAIEEAVFEQLKHDYKNKPINIEISASSFNNDSEVTILTNQLEQIETKEKRVKLAYENGIDSIEEYKENRERLSAEKKKVSSKLEELSKTKDVTIIRDKIFKRCKDAYDMLKDDTLSADDKSIITHQLFEKIVFVKSEHKLVIYYR